MRRVSVPPYVIDNPKSNQVYPLPPGVDVKDVIVTNNVHSPDHYKLPGGMEAIEIIKQQLSKEEYIGYLRGNIAKYTLRYKEKNGVEDLQKAQRYLGWLIDEYL